MKILNILKTKFYLMKTEVLIQMTIDALFKYMIKNFGEGEKQDPMKYDRMVKKPVRIPHLLECEKQVNELYFNLKNIFFLFIFVSK